MKSLSHQKSTVWKLMILGAYLLFIAACSSSDHDDHGHSGGHAHHAPHGGSLVMLGDHLYQLEMVAHEESSELELFILDGEAENFIRIIAPTLSAAVQADGEEFPLIFAAKSDEATGETVGNTSHFTANTPWLAEHPKFEAVFEVIEIRGQRFENIHFPFPEGSH